MCIRDRVGEIAVCYGNGEKAGVDLVAPVSYTHLDVYKRQTLLSAGTSGTLFHDVLPGGAAAGSSRSGGGLYFAGFFKIVNSGNSLKMSRGSCVKKGFTSWLWNR